MPKARLVTRKSTGRKTPRNLPHPQKATSKDFEEVSSDSEESEVEGKVERAPDCYSQKVRMTSGSQKVTNEDSGEESSVFEVDEDTDEDAVWHDEDSEDDEDEALGLRPRPRPRHPPGFYSQIARKSTGGKAPRKLTYKPTRQKLDDDYILAEYYEYMSHLSNQKTQKSTSGKEAGKEDLKDTNSERVALGDTGCYTGCATNKV